MAVIGLKYLAVAGLATAVDGSAPTYTSGQNVSHLVKADLTWNRGDVKNFGDNVLVERDNSITSGQLTISTTYLPIAARTALLNDRTFGTPASTEPQVYATDDDPAPYVGIGFVTKDSGDGTPKFTAWWYYKCQFSMNETANTRGENTEYQNPEMVGEVIAVRPGADMKNRFREFVIFDTEATAIAWVKTKAGISG